MKRIVLVVGALASAIVVVVAGVAASSSGDDTIRFFIRDNVQATLDLGATGPSQGDQFAYHGKVFTEKDGEEIGRFAGVCTTFSAASDVPEDSDCSLYYVLPKGQLMTRLIAPTADVFGGGSVDFAVLGGTGAYRDARGSGNIVVPTDVPDQTDAYVVLNQR